MLNGNGNNTRLPFYVLGVLAAAVLSLGAYVWTQTQQEIAQQRLTDQEMRVQITALRTDIIERLEKLSMARDLQIRDLERRVLRFLHQHELALERLGARPRELPVPEESGR